MFILILCLLYTVSAQLVSPVYSRKYLHDLKRLENERIQLKIINRGIAFIEDAIFTAAKQGLTNYTTEPFNGCERFTKPSELAPFGFDKEICENIINGIHTLVSERFPDSEISYDDITKRYTLKWD
jgi:hypothetical protein